MNRTIKDAMAKRSDYEDYEQLRQQHAGFGATSALRIVEVPIRLRSFEAIRAALKQASHQFTRTSSIKYVRRGRESG
ncbi:hypothetical protein [Fulvimarina pelagi]|uniref:hypothetical protein n=1 Tax=Fulvimarina pelagi TaxID=217511 RepID=UPI0011D0E5F6|nr:hypothetical protein [Fulvimarina pelagi]